MPIAGVRKWIFENMSDAPRQWPYSPKQMDGSIYKIQIKLNWLASKQNLNEGKISVIHIFYSYLENFDIHLDICLIAEFRLE